MLHLRREIASVQDFYSLKEMMYAKMNRPPLCPILLLLVTLFLFGCGPEQMHQEAESPGVTSLSAAAQLVASPLATVSQQASLLPTITPTPLRSTLYFPTTEPERHPMATPNFYDWGDTALKGITYTMQTDTGFGHFSFNNISPCLCQSTQNTGECSREIEAYLLSAGIEGVVRAEQCISIELANDRIATFNNISDMVGSVSYAYQEKLSDINFHLLRIGYWEGGDYMLVDGESGKVTVVPGYPVFSPNNRYFAIAFYPMGSMGYTLLVQIWNFEDSTPRFEQGWLLEKLPEKMPSSPIPVLTWTSAKSFQIRLETPDEEPSALIDVMAGLVSDEWTIYYNYKPIVQPIVEFDTIRFALSGLSSPGLMSQLAVGELVYSDRNYLFTSIPNELVGATQIRIPQYFYIGEEPDYFSVEQQMSNYLVFQVNDDARVYVGLDAQTRELPDWMQSGWEAVDFRLETNDIPLQLYRKNYPSGATVELLDRWMFDDRVPSQFIVIVTPDYDNE